MKFIDYTKTKIKFSCKICGVPSKLSAFTYRNERFLAYCTLRICTLRIEKSVLCELRNAKYNKRVLMGLTVN